MINFDRRYELHLPEMEIQHQYLYSLFDNLQNYHTGDISIKSLLEEIERYILFHFNCEEHLMRLYKFEGFAIHQSSHEQFSVRFVQFLDDFDQNSLNIKALQIFLTGWLMEHSTEADSLYVNWIIEQRRLVSNLKQI